MHIVNSTRLINFSALCFTLHTPIRSKLLLTLFYSLPLFFFAANTCIDCSYRNVKSTLFLYCSLKNWCGFNNLCLIFLRRISIMFMDLLSNLKWILDLYLHFRESMVGQTKKTIKPIKRKMLCLDISNHNENILKNKLKYHLVARPKKANDEIASKNDDQSQNMFIWVFFFWFFCMLKFFSSKYFVHSARIFWYFHLNDSSRDACVCVFESENRLNKTPSIQSMVTNAIIIYLIEYVLSFHAMRKHV